METGDAVSVAEARRRLSELLGRVRYGGETVVITRRGKPMAKLVPLDDPSGTRGLADVQGWLSDGDPFLDAVDELVQARAEHRPRADRRSRSRRSR